MARKKTSKDAHDPRKAKRGAVPSGISDQKQPGPAAVVVGERESVAPVEKLSSPGVPVVGIGASAGGLQALEEFFRHTPVDSGIAFVVVTHLHPGHTSILPELIGRTTRMPVTEAAEGTRVEPNHVYVNPPGKLLILRNGALHQVEAAEGELPRLPVDSFFRSLAAERREHANCIVLSGTGSDGTLGLKAVKAEAGMAMVQQPQSAQYPGMPENAINTGLADYVLPPREMPAQLVAYVRGAYLQAPRPVEEHEERQLEPLQEVLNLLRIGTGHDFSEYKSGTVRRRVERRMNIRHVRDLAGYVRYLQENPAEVTLLFKDLLISVTSFFRDPPAFEALAASLPPLLAAHAPKTPFRAWVPGCASGEEAFSIAILLQEVMQQLKRPLNMQVFATDLDAAAIEQARSAVYPDGIALDMSPERLTQWFVRDDGIYRVRKDLREMLIFAPHNLIRDPPFSRVDLLCCRNLLIYLNSDLQKRLIPLFHYALKPNGLLFLGTSETVGPFSDLFEAVDKHWKVYRRKGTAVAHPMLHLPLGAEAVAPGGRARFPEQRPEPMAALFERTLTGQFAPPCVIISDRGDILHLHGRTGAYLEPPSGQPRMNIFEMARDGLRLELSAAVRRASSGTTRVVHPNVRIKANGHDVAVNLEVVPLHEPESLRGLLLVAFHPIPEAVPAKRGKGKAATAPPARVTELERDLQRTRESLQTTVEELETSNEELRSANEELQSINEELQSSNEELETSKEEMQSLNEELTTVNTELEAKVDELRQANDDMQNLLNSTEVGTLFLDEWLCIQRFTEHARKLVNVISTDIGRPLADLTLNFRYDRLLADCRAVQESRAPREIEFQAADGVWYEARILPYRTGAGAISGLVLVFVNINRVKRAETALRESEAHLKSDAAALARLTEASSRLWRLEGLQPGLEEMLAATIELMGADYGNVQVLDPLRGLLQIVVQRGFKQPFLDCFREVSTKDDSACGRALRSGDRILIEDVETDAAYAPLRDVARAAGYRAVQSTPLISRSGATLGMLSTHWRLPHRPGEPELRLLELYARQAADFIERRRTDQVLREREDRLRAVLTTAADAIITIDRRGIIESFNPAAEKMFGYTAQEASGQNVAILMPSPYAEEHGAYLRRYQETGEARIIGVGRELIARHKDGRVFPIDLSVSEIDHLGLYTGIVRDISRHRALEEELLRIAGEEQQRIGQDLHDETGQELTALLLLADTLVEEAQGGKPHDQQLADKVRDGIRRALNQVRSYSRGLMPVDLDAEGLQAALATMAAGIAESHDIECTFECRAPVQVGDGKAATHLYRIAQEAITNAVRHARPSRIQVSLTEGSDAIRLQVADDGVGIGRVPLNGEGLGLRIMRHRANLIGAQLTVAPRRDGGTEVVCMLAKGRPQAPAVSDTREIAQ
jgi:two-component system CheB/CheR fusion protein